MSKMRLFAVIAAAALALTACGGSSGSTSTESGRTERRQQGGSDGFTPPKLTALEKLGTPEGELNIVAWAGYAEDGSTDPKVDWVTPFEKATGCQVNVKTAPTSDDMVNLMKTGQYDVVSASGDASLRMIASGDVEPVNTDLVPNYADVFDALKMKPWNSVNGVVLRHPARPRREPVDVPHRQGVAGADSWRRGVRQGDRPTRAHVTAYDSPIYIADAARLPDGDQARPRIKNPYALDDKQFAAAVDLLKKQNADIGEYWSDYTKEITAFKNGDSVVGTTWQIIANLAQADKAPVEAVLPSEGATGWSDTWMVATKSKHKTCAYKWMDWIISPKVERPGGRVVRRGAVEPEVLRGDGGQELLHDLPRRRRGLLRPGLVLDDADHASASTAAPRSRARTMETGRPRGRRSRADHGAGCPAALLRAARVGHPAPPPTAAARGSARGADGLARRRLPRRARRSCCSRRSGRRTPSPATS